MIQFKRLVRCVSTIKFLREQVHVRRDVRSSLSRLKI